MSRFVGGKGESTGAYKEVGEDTFILQPTPKSTIIHRFLGAFKNPFYNFRQKRAPTPHYKRYIINSG